MLLKIIPELRKLFLCEGRSVSSGFILYVNYTIKGYFKYGGKYEPNWWHMPARILKDCVDFHSYLLNKFLNTSLEKDCSPNQPKLTEVILVMKKDYELSSPVSVFSYASNIFEKKSFRQSESYCCF